jgi:hypothetical protein
LELIYEGATVCIKLNMCKWINLKVKHLTIHATFRNVRTNVECEFGLRLLNVNHDLLKRTNYVAPHHFTHNLGVKLLMYAANLYIVR